MIDWRSFARKRLQAGLTSLIGFRLRRVDQHDAVQLAGGLSNTTTASETISRISGVPSGSGLGATAQFALDARMS